jgi:hypothetical protein
VNILCSTVEPVTFERCTFERVARVVRPKDPSSVRQTHLRAAEAPSLNSLQRAHAVGEVAYAFGCFGCTVEGSSGAALELAPATSAVVRGLQARACWEGVVVGGGAVASLANCVLEHFHTFGLQVRRPRCRRVGQCTAHICTCMCVRAALSIRLCCPQCASVHADGCTHSAHACAPMRRSTARRSSATAQFGTPRARSRCTGARCTCMPAACRSPLAASHASLERFTAPR